MGTTLEFGPRLPLTCLHTEMISGGPFRLKPGEWTDDTAMAVGLAHSLLEQQRFDPFSIMSEWCAWYRNGKHSCTGTCFDVGSATRLALDQFLHNRTRLPPIPDSSQGNGTLMRLLRLFYSLGANKKRKAFPIGNPRSRTKKQQRGKPQNSARFSSRRCTAPLKNRASRKTFGIALGKTCTPLVSISIR